MAVRGRSTWGTIATVALVGTVACGTSSDRSSDEAAIATTTAAPTTAPPTASPPSTPATPTPPPGPELVGNGSLEARDRSGRPVGWAQVGWGDNDRSFSSTSGRPGSGTVGARAEITTYRDGAATWAFDPVAVQPSTSYRVSSWYRSNTEVEMLVVERDAAGTQSYPLRLLADPSTEWTEFDRPFTTSPRAASITLYQSVEGVGWVEVDDVSLRSHTPRRLHRPLVSLTFDDGTRSHHDVALPVLEEAGMRGTFYMVSGYLDDPRSQFLSTEMAKGLTKAGMVVGSHTVDHLRLPELTPAQLRHQLADSRRELEERLGVEVEDFASPYGESTPDARAEARARYRSHRTVEGRHNLVEFLDLSRLEARLVLDSTTPEDVEGWLREAEAEGGWLILIFHDLRDRPGEYDTTPERFGRMIDAVERSGLAVRTVSEARREVLAQT